LIIQVKEKIETINEFERVVFLICDKFRLFEDGYLQAIQLREVYMHSEPKTDIWTLVKRLDLRVHGYRQPDTSNDHTFKSIDSRSFIKSVKTHPLVPPIVSFDPYPDLEKSQKEDTMASRTYANTTDYEKSNAALLAGSSGKEARKSAGFF
jgi:hypothetical protein